MSADADRRAAADLRARAEAAMPKAGGGAADDAESARSTLHELRVHRIELEMQNDELRRTQGRLEASRARFVELYDRAPVGYCTLGADGAVREANLTLAAMLGATRGDVLSRPFTDFVHRDDQDRFYLLRRATAASPAPGAPASAECEARIVRTDGGATWTLLSAAAEPDADGGSGLRLIVTDIGAAKRAQTRSDRLAAIVASSDDGIVGKDRDGVVTSWNDGAAAMFGFSASEMVGKPLTPILPADRTEEDEAMRRRLVVGESVPHFETTRLTRDGRTIDVSIAASPIRDVDGTILGCSMSVRDITARKRAEAARATLETQLRQVRKLESIGRLAGGVAHDFNNMLGVILGHADRALTDEDVGPALREDLAAIRDAALRSAALTRQLLAFARKQAVAPRALDLNRKIEELLTLLRRLIGEDATLEWRPSDGVWPVWMDPSQLDQIVTNLCVNARDAIRRPGLVVVSTFNRRFSAEELRGRPDVAPGDYATLAVSDTGHGMSPATMARIFEPFFTTKGVGEGTGLGLATVDGAVRQNRGFVTVASALGKGSTFEVHLPRHAGVVEGEAPAAPRTASPPGGARGTVLVAEDEPRILLLATSVLRAEGYDVLPAAGPEEALRLAREHAGKFDLLLTDVIMPVMNGRDLAAAMRRIAPGLRCLFMSGYAADVLRRSGSDGSGPAPHFLQKPFRAIELTAAVRAALAAEPV